MENLSLLLLWLAVPARWRCPQTAAGMLFPSASKKRHGNGPLIP